MPNSPPKGAASSSRGESPLFSLLQFEEPVVDPICPDCRNPIRMEFAVTVYPVFWLHNRGGGRKACRLCLFRHPRSHEVNIRIVPDHLQFGDYLPVVLSELRAIAASPRRPTP